MTELSMKGKICLVTGATAGIGRQAALELARKGATVVLVARDSARGEATRAALSEAAGAGQFDLLHADLSSIASIKSMADVFRARYGQVNVLLNNAGVYLTKRKESVDGLEMTFATNHVGYFLPTVLLWDLLVAGAPARVVNVSSNAHYAAKLDFDDLQSRRKYAGYSAYCKSKLANLLFTFELDRRRGDADVTVNALHPGFVASNFGRSNRGIVGFVMTRLVPYVARTVEEGAETPVYLSSSADMEGISGRYFVDCVPVESSAASHDRAAAVRLWAISEELTGTPTPHLAPPGL